MNPSTELRLEGPHLILRSMRPEDADDSYHRWMNDPEITRHLESRFTVHSVEDIRQFIINTSLDPRYVFLAICTRSDGRHIGNIKLGPIIQPHRYADIGLIIGEKDCWGHGYATEAVTLLAEHAFNHLKLHKLTAGCYSTNMASARAFEKAGFIIEARRVSQYWQDEAYVDCILMGKHNPSESL